MYELGSQVRMVAQGRVLAAAARLALALCLIWTLAGCGSGPATEGTVRTVEATPRIRRSYLTTETPSLAGGAAGQGVRAVVKETANLRSGPGTAFDRVGSAAEGDPVDLIARDSDGDWYQLTSGAWIAAFLVEGATAATGLPVVDAPSAPTPAAAATPVVAAATVPVGAVFARLSRVVDGDTIDVLIGGRQETVRYIGIDTPERGQPGHRAATAANAALLGAGDLYLAADTSERDRYGRLLRYVYTPDGTLVNQEMAAQGWAQPVEYPPDIRYAAELRQAAVDAAGAGLGFWSGVASDGVTPYALTAGNVNIRTGPGTDFAISSTAPDNTPLTVFGRTADGEWLQVRTPDRSGGWVATGLVVLAAALAEVEVMNDAPAAPAGALLDATRGGDGALAAVLADTDSAVQIAALNPAGDDETVVIQNAGPAAVDLSGWSIQSYGGSSCQPVADQVFRFPDGFLLEPGAAVRVHSGPDAVDNPPSDLLWTTEAIWNNGDDRSDLRDASSRVVGSRAYGRCRR